jgi:two-component system, LytTR family, sensor histidine kinase AlgZ
MHKGNGMSSAKHKWAFSLLWINLAVAVVVLIQIAGNQISSVRELLQMLAYSLVYANLTGVLGVWIIGGLAEHLALRKFPPVPVLALGVLAITALGGLLAQTLLMEMGFLSPQHFWQQYLRTLRVAVPLAMVFSLGAMVHGSLRERMQTMEENLREKEAAEDRARKLALEARLSSLESRIHPHFLFNTLNSISSLITVDPVRAEQTVGRLAVLLRASLDTSNLPLIPLQQELAMVESYVDIQRVRFGDKLRGSVDVATELQNAKVPPMSVQALVENAVKHGITPQSGGGEFRITASSENGSLRIEVRDTGPGFDLAGIRAGHGLDNLVERLDALFGAKAGLTVFRRDGYSVVEMVLPRV